MKKRYWAALAAGTVAGAWCIHRDRKYPVRPELRFANKLAVPGCILNADMARLASRALAWISCKPPAPPHGIERWGTQIPSEDGASIHLTIYKQKTLREPCPAWGCYAVSFPETFIE